jgi:nucleoside-diphosphate-sugar epimerase
MKMLVTGAGLVGCNVARIAAERGHDAILFDRSPNRPYIESVAKSVPVVTGDVQDMSTLIETLQGRRIDTVVHTAYWIGDALSQRPYVGVRANIDGCLALIEAARLSSVRRFIFASTFGIYDWGLGPKAPLTEEYPVAGDHFYIASKIAAERVLTSFARAYGIEFAILRFAQIYGRGHYAGGDFAGIAMHQALSAALSGEPVRLDPGVITVNDYVYVRDVAEGVMLACEKPLKHVVYNLGSGVLGTPRDVVAAIRDAVPGARVEILPQPVLGPYWVHEQILDLTRSRQELGYDPRLDLGEGVADFARRLRAAR